MKDNDVFATCLGIVVSIGVVLVVGTVANGWALVTTWNWFMPRLFGLTSLTLWQAMGVSMVFSVFTGTNRIKNSDRDVSDKSYGEVFLASLIEVILAPVLTVVFAWIILQLAF